MQCYHKVFQNVEPALDMLIFATSHCSSVPFIKDNIIKDIFSSQKKIQLQHSMWRTANKLYAIQFSASSFASSVQQHRVKNIFNLGSTLITWLPTATSKALYLAGTAASRTVSSCSRSWTRSLQLVFLCHATQCQGTRLPVCPQDSHFKSKPVSVALLCATVLQIRAKLSHQWWLERRGRKLLLSTQVETLKF